MPLSQSAKSAVDQLNDWLDPEEQIVMTFFSKEDIELAVQNEDIDGDNPALMEWASDNAEDLWLSFTQSRILDKELDYLHEGIRQAIAHHIESEFKRNQLESIASEQDAEAGN
jgi:hypothetical protein